MIEYQNKELAPIPNKGSPRYGEDWWAKVDPYITGNDYTYRAIAEHFGVSIQTVKNRAKKIGHSRRRNS